MKRFSSRVQSNQALHQDGCHAHHAPLQHASAKPPSILPRKRTPLLTADGAFEVQKITAENAVNSGDRHVGYKLGNIAKVMQAAFGLDHPDYGFLLGSFFLHEGQKVSLSKFIKPYVELEPAFVLKGHLKGPNVTIADVVRAIDFAIPAIEIIDSRVKNWEISLEDTLADNGSQGTLKFNGTEVMTGNTQNILGNPLAATAWLVNRLAQYDVEFLPGHVIMPGSCLQAMPMDKPGRWTCSFEGWGASNLMWLSK
ncbi:hypothetical protein ACCO45_006488 [Purpureocillium lilacinum]|uniref:Uncharacterized protein n=1 Tax=Purpureocillium lilacinum TaxID=33203 RepID=A0ACC4DPZ7_PURLI